MFRKLLAFSFFLSLFVFSSFLSLSAQKLVIHKYVGTKVCGKCHKSAKQGKQYKIWKESIHAQAYEVLKTPKADKYSKEMGYGDKAVESKHCLSCHTSGLEVDAKFRGPKFKIEDGVQCETCHGAGNDYKSIKIMKNRKLAMKNGLVNVFENTEEFCRTCHNPESPTFSGFNFKEMWAKIEHEIPHRKKK